MATWTDVHKNRFQVCDWYINNLTSHIYEVKLFLENLGRYKNYENDFLYFYEYKHFQPAIREPKTPRKWWTHYFFADDERKKKRGGQLMK